MAAEREFFLHLALTDLVAEEQDVRLRASMLPGLMAGVAVVLGACHPRPRGVAARAAAIPAIPADVHGRCTPQRTRDFFCPMQNWPWMRSWCCRMKAWRFWRWRTFPARRKGALPPAHLRWRSPSPHSPRARRASGAHRPATGHGFRDPPCEVEVHTQEQWNEAFGGDWDDDDDDGVDQPPPEVRGAALAPTRGARCRACAALPCLKRCRARSRVHAPSRTPQ